MKRLSITNFRLILVILILGTINAHAQKLPNKQEISLRAPGNIKIDGVAAEWGGQFAAFNKSAQIFYTVSNDDNNIYLTVQAARAATIQKIIAYGLTFTVNGPAINNGKQHVAVTFPVFKTAGDYQSINRNLAYNPATFLTGEAVIKKVTDSLVYAMNNQIITKANEFSVAGLTMAADTLIQLNNETGIKAIGLFENKNTYTFEVAIPVKYLGGNADKLSYNIKINGAAADKNKNTEHYSVIKTAIVAVRAEDVPALQQQIASNNARVVPITSDDPIDFSGEYTLAKKHVVNQ
jgi:hypothetical protein